MQHWNSIKLYFQGLVCVCVHMFYPSDGSFIHLTLVLMIWLLFIIIPNQTLCLKIKHKPHNTPISAYHPHNTTITPVWQVGKLRCKMFTEQKVSHTWEEVVKIQIQEAIKGTMLD